MLIIINMNGETEDQAHEDPENQPTKEEMEEWHRQMPQPELSIVPYF